MADGATGRKGGELSFIAFDKKKLTLVSEDENIREFAEKKIEELNFI